MPEQLELAPSVSAGLCGCGCGGRTSLAKQNDPVRGYVKGEPVRFIHGHHSRAPKKLQRYTVEDCSHDTPCWIWQLAKQGTGYGKTVHSGRFALAHRVYYERFKGPIPEGLVLDHLCRNRACVNPDHLEAVTHIENCQRGQAGRRKLTAAQVLEIRASDEGSSVLAARYGVDRGSIKNIRARRTWKLLEAA